MIFTLVVVLFLFWFLFLRGREGFLEGLAPTPKKSINKKGDPSKQTGVVTRSTVDTAKAAEEAAAEAAAKAAAEAEAKEAAEAAAKAAAAKAAEAAAKAAAARTGTRQLNAPRSTLPNTVSKLK